MKKSLPNYSAHCLTLITLRKMEGRPSTLHLDLQEPRISVNEETQLDNRRKSPHRAHGNIPRVGNYSVCLSKLSSRASDSKLCSCFSEKLLHANGTISSFP